MAPAWISSAVECSGGGTGRISWRAVPGRDILKGGPGNDTLRGGAGSDIFESADGHETYQGGLGVDVLSFSVFRRPVRANLLAGTARASNLVAAITGIENLFGGSAGDRFTGDEHGNRLDGAGGDDVIAGKGGDDRLIGRSRE